MHFSEGQVITADFLPGPARVKKFEDRGAFSRLEVIIEATGEYWARNLLPDQVAQIEMVTQDPLALSSDPEEFFLLIEANRIRLAHQFDPLLAVSVSQVDPLPHQIEAVYHYVLDMPRVRFLIADDPGAGKTIMAGLVLKEMQYRGLAQRVLIVAPGHLKYQWQRELKEKFNTKFRLVDRSSFRSAWGENVWEEYTQAVTSIDFLKQDDIKATLRSTRWDLIIVDEAHKMAAYAYETRERVKIDKTKRYQVGEVLSEQADHLLFLTATPHKGDEENFRLFLDLLRPGFFAKTELLKESVQRGDNPLFVRRLKEDMRTFSGERIFPPRNVQTLSFRMTEAEIRLYNAVTSYVKNYFDQARENRNIAFAMIILQRRLTSSVYAILSSLRRRRERLQELLALPEKIRGDERYDEVRGISEEELEDLSEEERWEIEERLEHLTIARNIEDVRLEIEQLEALIVQAEEVRRQEVESKLVKLRDEILDNLGGRKLLIFTEHKDTLWYLEDKLRAWGYDVNTIHGGMSLDARIEAEHVFRHESQIMVATEAAGEGINLQFCSLMVNYDIPWNPNRLEQRMGRIHRYGQEQEVYIWNLVSKDTREGQILDRLFDKLDRIRQALGNDRVFDIIGEVIPGTNLSELLKDAIFNQRRMEEIEAQIEEVDVASAQATMDRLFMTGLATRHIDYTGLQRETLKAEENRLVPEYVKDFFLRAFQRLGGRVTPLDPGYRIDVVPFELRRLNEDYNFKTAYGKIFREYRHVTFDKQLARHHPEYEFVAPGHPLLEALNETILRQFGQNTGQYAAFTDPEGRREGALWFVEGVVRDGSGAAAGRRVFCLLQGTDGSVRTLNPAVLWDLEPGAEQEIPAGIQEQMRDRDGIESHIVTEILFPYREEMAERRDHDAQIKERYGLRSLDYLIQRSNQKLLEYEMREAGGTDMAIVIRNERRNLEQLERRREALVREIRLERNLTVDEPRIMGVAAVVVDTDAQDERIGIEGGRDEVDGIRGERMVREGAVGYEVDGGVDSERRREIELVGMEVARGYEEERGWQVEDVSEAEHGGFDLRSMHFNEEGMLDGIHYIEVKARAQSGAIRLTSNEWKRARQWGNDFWLYIVTQAGTGDPQLTRIQNPALRFVEGEDIFATGFIIQEDTWRQQAEVSLE